jgi:hypothetical protein
VKNKTYSDLYQLKSVLFARRLFRIFPTWWKLSYEDDGYQIAVYWLGFEFIWERLINDGWGASTLKEWNEKYEH